MSRKINRKKRSSLKYNKEAPFLDETTQSFDSEQKCGKEVSTCFVLRKDIDRTNMKEKFINLLDFIEQLLNATESFNEKLFEMFKDQGNIELDAPNMCFSFIDKESGCTLNEYYYAFKSILNSLQSFCSVPQFEEDYEVFLQQTLDQLNTFIGESSKLWELRVRNLMLKIEKFNNTNVKVTSYEIFDVECEIKTEILRLIEKLQKIVSNFNCNSEDQTLQFLKNQVLDKLDTTYKNNYEQREKILPPPEPQNLQLNNFSVSSNQINLTEKKDNDKISLEGLDSRTLLRECPIQKPQPPKVEIGTEPTLTIALSFGILGMFLLLIICFLCLFIIYKRSRRKHKTKSQSLEKVRILEENN